MSETAVIKSGGNNGVAPIKAAYLLRHPSADGRREVVIDDDAAERATNPTRKTSEVQKSGAEGEQRVKLSGAARKRLRRAEAAEERKQKRGMNTNRKFQHIHDDHALCSFVARQQTCPHGEQACKFSHSLTEYLRNKPKDVRFPRPPTSSIQGGLRELNSEEARRAYIDLNYASSEPYVKFSNKETFGSIDVETVCPIVLAQQAASSSSTSAHEPFCFAGWTCRFLGGHCRKTDDAAGTSGGWALIGEANATSRSTEFDQDGRKSASDEKNWVDLTIPRSLRTRSYPLYLTDAVLEQLEEEKRRNSTGKGRLVVDEKQAQMRFAVKKASNGGIRKQTQQDDAEDMDALMNDAGAGLRPPSSSDRVEEAAHSASLTDVARTRPGEKKRLDWFHDELYLAPLTTTGNLPFRRLCVSFGADITCGEMGLADSYLHGSKTEWSLVRRWQGERCFGTQVCGSRPELLVPTAEVLAREFGDGLDFIDVNCGCPIDMVFTKGAGSALLDHHGRLGRIVRGMNAVSGDLPITVKLRTGTASNTPTTHKLFPRLGPLEWGVGAATLHGRSRQQRYKQPADWTYIRRCTEAFRESMTHANEDNPDEEYAHPIPIYGNGDVYSWQDYEANKALTGVDGQMLARGALVKPWLFTEIKERRDWDISSRERLDVIRQFCSYGITHWGSDSMGVNQTRRFLCEALSFMHRYIPIGLLERLPVHLHDRPPPFVGRDDLETLLASSNAQDWVKISELFLGKAPEQWSFTPKHKSNAYEADTTGEDQG